MGRSTRPPRWTWPTFPLQRKRRLHGPKRAHPLKTISTISRCIVYEIYKRDFELFKYDPQDPSNKMPIGDIDLDEVHAKLGDA